MCNEVHVSSKDRVLLVTHKYAVYLFFHCLIGIGNALFVVVSVGIKYVSLYLDVHNLFGSKIECIFCTCIDT